MSKTKTDYSQFIITGEQALREALAEGPATPVRLVLEGEADQLAALLRAMAPPKRCRKLTKFQEDEIYRRVLEGETRSALADEFKVTRQAVAKMVQRRQQEDESA